MHHCLHAFCSRPANQATDNHSERSKRQNMYSFKNRPSARPFSWKPVLRLTGISSLSASFYVHILNFLSGLLSPLVSLHTTHWTKTLSVCGICQCTAMQIHLFRTFSVVSFHLICCILFFFIVIMGLSRVQWTFKKRLLLWNFKVCMLKQTNANSLL